MATDDPRPDGAGPDVVDHRDQTPSPVPARLTPKKALILGGAVVVLLVMALFGRPTPTTVSAPAAATAQALIAPLPLAQTADLARYLATQAMQAPPPPTGPLTVQPVADVDPLPPSGGGSPRARTAYDASPDSAWSASSGAAPAPRRRAPLLISRLPVLGSGAPEGRQAGQDGTTDALAAAVTRSYLEATNGLPAGAGGQIRPIQAPSAPAPAPATTPTGATQAPVLPPGHHWLRQGTILPGVLVNRLDSSFDGPVTVQVTQPVYAEDRTLVVPAGARLFGESRAVNGFGEERMLVTFSRLLRPDGTDVRLDDLPAMNQAGDVGLKDKVNHHYLSTFGVSAAVGLISGFSQWLAGGLGDGSDTAIVIGGVGDATAQATTQVLQHFLNRRPTVTIREGHRVVAYLTHDLAVPTYGGVE